MAFKRIEAKTDYPSGDALASDLAGIGFRFASVKPNQNPNIEDALIAGAIEGLEREDFRILSMLTDWFEIHGEWVNVDRLVRAVKKLKSDRVMAYFAALGEWKKADPRYKKLSALHRGGRVSLGCADSYSFLVSRNGEDERFQATCLLVAKGHLRRRPEDVLSPKKLALRHHDYYWRVCLGPSYRADMISLARREPDATPAEIARKTYGSFQTAWFVKRDLSILPSAV